MSYEGLPQKCVKCRQYKKLNSDNFERAKTKVGFKNICKQCDNKKYENKNT
jgi:hypothetical protein